VLEIVKREHPDVLHAHSSYTNAYAALPAARRFRVPLVYEVRTLWGESAVVEDRLRPDSWKHWLIWQLELKAMRRADLVVPIARGIRDQLIRRGISPDALEVVPNGVDTTRFVPQPRDDARAHAAGVAGHFVIGFIGSIRRLEGLATLLEAFAICRAQRPKVALVIVGDGAERKALEARASHLGLSGVVFTGNVPHAEVASWYSIMDVMVYPRIRAVINEHVTPLKPLEAMALGKVCAASNVGGLMELIRNDETGVIFRSDDEGDLASALIQLMDDPVRRERLRQTALEFVRRERDWSAIVPRYRDIYERLLHRKNLGVTVAAPASANKSETDHR
jgi:glycogen(starch) synthase